MDSELIFWIVAAIASIVAFGVLWAIGKRESENYIEWIAEKKYF